jgi:hypothetical protein
MSSCSRTDSLFLAAMVASLVMLAGCGTTLDVSDPGADDDSLRPAAKVTVQATASPTTVGSNQEVLGRLTITSSRAVSADVTLRVLSPAGVVVYTARWPGQSLSPGTPLLLEEAMAVDPTDPTGVYSIGALVQKTGTTTTLFDANALATFTVAPAAGESATCLTASLSALTSSPDDGTNHVANVADNDLNTRWSSLGKGAWVQADLGASKSVCSVAIAWHQGDARRNTFEVQLSADGTTFATAYSGTSSGSTLALESYDFGDTLARYVRIVVNGNTVNDWASISEIQVLAGGSASGDTQSPTAPGNLTATAVSANQIDLAWGASTDNVGVTGYRIFRGSTQVGTRAASVRTYSDTGLTASTAYSYTVRAVDAAGNLSAASNNATATTSGQTCVPSCSGKVCGSDGCGGSCGTCGSGQTCNGSGQCQTTSSGGCLSSPSSCGFPDATNTGAKGTLTKQTGNVTLTSGQVFQNVDLTGCINVTGPNVTIRNVKVTCNGSYAIYYHGAGGGTLTVEDSTVICTSVYGSGIGDTNLATRRVNVFGCVNGWDLDANSLIEDSYCHDLVDEGQYPEAHTDCIQGVMTNDITIRHNTLLSGFYSTSAIGGGVAGTRFVVEQNLLEGGAYDLYCNANNPGTGSAVRNNRFGSGGWNGPNYSTGCSNPNITWSGNVRDATGAALSAQ